MARTGRPREYTQADIRRIKLAMDSLGIKSVTGMLDMLRGSPALCQRFGIPKVPHRNTLYHIPSEPTVSRYLKVGKLAWNRGIPVMVTACARCSHGSNVHKYHNGNQRGCNKCDCPKWVGGKCFACEGWCFRDSGMCRTCYSQWVADRRAIMAAYTGSSEYRDEQERKAQLQWLRDGKQTLRQVRRLLREQSLPA